MAPQSGVNGVLPVAVLQKNAPASTSHGPKVSQPRLKLVLRRLPPGLTKAEFDSALGEEWKLGGGKVDWMVFKKGKLSKDLAKPSKPGRAYIHVTSQNHVAPLGDHVRQASFHDAAKTFQDPALIGPPVLEFSPYPRMPGGRRKNDARQGLIDQDPEFKAFLESLTNPVPKPSLADAAVEAQKEEKVKTTPLIEAIREKKANKEKPQSKVSPKHTRGDSKDTGGDKPEKKILSKPGKDATPVAGDKGKRMSKSEKAAKDAVKVLTKEASMSQAKSSPSAAPADKVASTAAPERKRGSTAIAKSMLQRDLGIGPAANRRRGTKREVTPAQDTVAKVEDNASGKQKVKEAVPAPAAPEKHNKATPPPKKESSRPSRAERRAFKASLADKTNNKASGEDTKPQTKPNPVLSAPTILKKPQVAPQPSAQPSNPPPKGPAASRAPPTEPAAVRASSATAPASKKPGPTPGNTGRQAFLKHANASQGISEPLIEEALKVYGAIEKVEIDKRKGFAYVNFAEPDGLRKAIAASPVKVAQGAVQVLERKEKMVRNRPAPHQTHPTHPPHQTHAPPPTGPARGRGGFSGRGRGGRGGGRGGAVNTGSLGSNVSGAAPAAAAPVASAGTPT
ncbi:hypothetical protein GQ43DRAFT_369753 [Delitschia confertaspora ATCC 74209]|uniref:RRM domain-containing protein n=1 Tax=Delitschia confertaspora ATCC 74209 TaxID=1513339 RepID=A0A9P4JRY9_9PLEO|nr:hypothetical protein GQ43DRAFT_369753 [Delitschia confertaspora ATCC 74209]